SSIYPTSRSIDYASFFDETVLLSLRFMKNRRFLFLRAFFWYSVRNKEWIGWFLLNSSSSFP
ncbi:hypothetical protein, partial [Bacillus cereus]|uniref:hypothetical protein n=1 Tax=Bacillus cereus TaxID=1396 RepID=UPI0028528B58